MAKVKSLADKISETESRIQQLKAQKDKWVREQNEKERKERTRRLIQIGGIFASIGIDTVEKADQVKNELLKNKEFKKMISKMGLEDVDLNAGEGKEV